jgi:carboxypeptidase Q
MTPFVGAGNESMFRDQARKPTPRTPGALGGPLACALALTLALLWASLTMGQQGGAAQDSGSAASQAALADNGAPSMVQRYAAPARRIIKAALADEHPYQRMIELCDDIGHRLSGSIGLERAIEWAQQCFREDRQENVRAEPVMVPKWVRGRESLELLEPREMPLSMLGLGGSVGTPPEGLVADVVAVRDLEELNALGRAVVAGKIVLFDFPMTSGEDGRGYGSAVQYRANGARWALEHGAVGVLVRSCTTRSLLTPHTGAMSYLDARRGIPAASLATEHATMISRFQARGRKVRVRLKMEARDAGRAPSANVVAELRGREKPDEIVVVGGHLDSWDVGQGAHDDGGGCVSSMAALRLLRRLDLVPRRTIRVVLFTNEENGLAGGKAYAEQHADELARHVAAIETDSGIFQPLGFSVDAEDPARLRRAAEQLGPILELLDPIGATRVTSGSSGADVSQMKPAGVLVMGLNVDGTHYFDYHHTHADTVDKIDPDELNRNVAALAVITYVLADMPGRLGDP